MTVDRPRALLFDLDGTLVDSHGAIYASVVHTLREHELPLDETRLAQSMSRPLRDLFRHVTQEADERLIDAYTKTYLDHYVRTMVEKSPPFPGIVEMLDALLELGLPLGVLTNKTEINARKISDAHFGTVRFREFVGSVPERPNKPAPDGALLAASRLGTEPGAVWLVGDSPIDIATARNAGMVSVAAAWSLDARAEALVADATLRAESPSSLVELVRTALHPSR